MFNVIILGDLRLLPLREILRRRGCLVSEIHYSAFLRTLSLDVGMVSDVVICFPLPDAHYRTGYLSYSKAKELKSQMLALSDDICMPDGRKWRAIPFLTLSSEREMGSVFLDARNSSAEVQSFFDDEEAFRLIKTAVDAYRKKVIDGFDDLGFLVKYENGRFRLGQPWAAKRISRMTTIRAWPIEQGPTGQVWSQLIGISMGCNTRLNS